MGIRDDVAAFYKDNRISATDFHCHHVERCKSGCSSFVEAREAMIPDGYENGILPRILFVSLDPGKEGESLENRVLGTRCGCNFQELPKALHWYRTHELAFAMLRQFDPKLQIENAHDYFAHTNSAKCCMNNPKSAMASKVLFDNCRGYIRGELIALQPDVVVTQGDFAKVAVEVSSSSIEIRGAMKACGHAVMHLNGRTILWIHTYHPRAFGYFNRQRRHCYSAWAEVIKTFIETESSRRSPPAGAAATT
jgi:uracil-DNA glycosylase